MGINITDLPEAYQRQALEKLRANNNNASKVPNEIAKGPASTAGLKQSKYHNQPTEINEIKFSSKKEGNRFILLIDKVGRGEISDLKLQPQFTLQESYMTPQGERVRAIRYVADFSYIDNQTGKLVVEDVKSKPTRTKVYLIKKKLMQEKLNITVREV